MEVVTGIILTIDPIDAVLRACFMDLFSVSLILFSLRRPIRPADDVPVTSLSSTLWTSRYFDQSKRWVPKRYVKRGPYNIGENNAVALPTTRG